MNSLYIKWGLSLFSIISLELIKVAWNYIYYLVRNDIDVNEHERLSNITLGHTLK